MPEPFKNFFSPELIISMAGHLSRHNDYFDPDAFIAAASHKLEKLELKQRSTQITDALAATLPRDYTKAAEILLSSLSPKTTDELSFTSINTRGIEGWGVMPLVDYVGLHGRDHFDLSMTLFKEMTMRSSSEFGIRYFLMAEPERCIATLQTWLKDPNVHVRRLISEGTRPRLPWGMRLPAFVHNPAPVIALLEALKDDSAEYVRRSVANNLNDIAKDHPDLVAKIAHNWMAGASADRKRLIRHALRSLIKQGHPEALKALGYGPPQVSLDHLKIETEKVEFGNPLTFHMSISSTGDQDQKLVIDYAIHHQKANGSTSPKMFKWKNINLKPSGALKATRNHAIRKITTRAYYPGPHHLEIFINGISYATQTFELTMD